jgi:hypothetical protein
MNSQSTVVFTTTAVEFNQLLNDANCRHTLEADIAAYKIAVKELQSHLAAIGRYVYESEGKYNTWISISDTEDSNEALKYAKQLSWELK